MKVLGIIPARFGATRFPGKPLHLIAGKPLVQWVWEGTTKTGLLDELVVATDHADIEQAVVSFGGKAILTAPSHSSGTERCAEALEKSGGRFDAVINIQGDEPLVSRDHLQRVRELLEAEAPIATLVKRVEDQETLANPNVVKVVRQEDGRALYFSRSAIPFVRNIEVPAQYFRHIGIYGYQSDVLREIVNLAPTLPEQLEQLEQLRWLGHGYAIHTAETTEEAFGVDVPEDVAKVERLLR